MQIFEELKIQLQNTVHLLDEAQLLVKSHILQLSCEQDFSLVFSLFVMAIFVGYYVINKVTPALHAPLMAVTNAISSVIIVGGIIALGQSNLLFVKALGFLAVFLCAVNIAGGFTITRRMLHLFSGRKIPKK